MMPFTMDLNRLTIPRRSFALLRLGVLLAVHTTIHRKHSSKAIPLYSNKAGMFDLTDRLFGSCSYRFLLVLYPHILFGLTETFKFAFEDVFRDPIPGGLDLTLCLLQSFTNLRLVAPLRRGTPSWTRGYLPRRYVHHCLTPVPPLRPIVSVRSLHPPAHVSTRLPHHKLSPPS